MEVGPIKAMSSVSAVSSLQQDRPRPSPEADPQVRREVARAVRELSVAQAFGPETEMTIAIDRDTGKAIVKIMSLDTKELLMQIPGDEALRLARSFANQAARVANQTSR
jgi:uncharacterized FlaG/YvyC family protein